MKDATERKHRGEERRDDTYSIAWLDLGFAENLKSRFDMNMVPPSGRSNGLSLKLGSSCVSISHFVIPI